MPASKKPITEELKRKAVHAFDNRGRTSARVIAESFGVSEGSLYYWSNGAKNASEPEPEPEPEQEPNHRTGYSGPSASTAHRSASSSMPSAELERLRRENSELKEQVSALRKAVLYFATSR